jgi:hypothetical protein
MICPSDRVARDRIDRSVIRALASARPTWVETRSMSIEVPQYERSGRPRPTWVETRSIEFPRCEQSGQPRPTWVRDASHRQQSICSEARAGGSPKRPSRPTRVPRFCASRSPSRSNSVDAFASTQRERSANEHLSAFEARSLSSCARVFEFACSRRENRSIRAHNANHCAENCSGRTAHREPTTVGESDVA